jgi:O-acetyl-ADP-ribose deacetylase (regulator of RNase III)
MKTEIIYLEGDATYPQADGNKIICHICNDIGAWGAGFVLAISKRWHEPENYYKRWYALKEKFSFELGKIQFVKVEDDICVVNMIAQYGIGYGRTNPPIRYKAVDECLQKLSKRALDFNASVHMPRIGCGLAGGKWENIEALIIKNLCSKGIQVFVYDFKGR